MGDAIEAMKALQTDRKHARQAAWDNRAKVIAQIEAAGFRVEVKSEESRHLRVYAATDWFDFWPSSGRWAQSTQKGGKRGRWGFGANDLIVAAESLG